MCDWRDAHYLSLAVHSQPEAATSKATTRIKNPIARRDTSEFSQDAIGVIQCLLMCGDASIIVAKVERKVVIVVPRCPIIEARLVVIMDDSLKPCLLHGWR